MLQKLLKLVFFHVLCVPLIVMGWVVILFAWVKQIADFIDIKQCITWFNKESL